MRLMPQDSKTYGRNLLYDIIRFLYFYFAQNIPTKIYLVIFSSNDTKLARQSSIVQSKTTERRCCQRKAAPTSWRRCGLWEKKRKKSLLIVYYSQVFTGRDDFTPAAKLLNRKKLNKTPLMLPSCAGKYGRTLPIHTL